MRELNVSLCQKNDDRVYVMVNNWIVCELYLKDEKLTMRRAGCIGDNKNFALEKNGKIVEED